MADSTAARKTLAGSYSGVSLLTMTLLTTKPSFIARWARCSRRWLLPEPKHPPTSMPPGWCPPDGRARSDARIAPKRSSISDCAEPRAATASRLGTPERKASIARRRATRGSRVVVLMASPCAFGSLPRLLPKRERIVAQADQGGEGVHPSPIPHFVGHPELEGRIGGQAPRLVGDEIERCHNGNQRCGEVVGCIHELAEDLVGIDHHGLRVVQALPFIGRRSPAYEHAADVEIEDQADMSGPHKPMGRGKEEVPGIVAGDAGVDERRAHTTHLPEVTAEPVQHGIPLCVVKVPRIEKRLADPQHGEPEL